MSLYEIRGNVLLNASAQAKDPDVLAALAQVAEDVLGLTGTSYTGAAAHRAAYAVVLQVNRMAVAPDDPTLTSHTMGDISKSWAARSDLAQMVDPLAAEVVAALAAEAAEAGEGEYTILTSLR